MPKDHEYPSNAQSPFSPELDSIKREEESLDPQSQGERNNNTVTSKVTQQSPFY